MSQLEYVVLVDSDDRPVGREEKLKAHQQGLCHRAFSVFIFRKNSEQQWQLLLQQRQFSKYHSGGLWTNTCCSHPREQEDILNAGQRRLFEEMGIHCTLTNVGNFHYIAHLDQGLTENELDHVLIGVCNESEIPFNSDEVAACRWITLPELEAELGQHPENFTQWFQQAYAIAKTGLKHLI